MFSRIFIERPQRLPLSVGDDGTHGRCGKRTFCHACRQLYRRFAFINPSVQHVVIAARHDGEQDGADYKKGVSE